MGWRGADRWADCHSEGCEGDDFQSGKSVGSFKLVQKGRAVGGQDIRREGDFEPLAVMSQIKKAPMRQQRLGKGQFKVFEVEDQQHPQEQTQRQSNGLCQQTDTCVIPVSAPVLGFKCRFGPAQLQPRLLPQQMEQEPQK